MNYIKPDFALISAGLKNKFHHPSNEVLERLQMLNANILRTDKQGAVILKSDGNSVAQVKWKDFSVHISK